MSKDLQVSPVSRLKEVMSNPSVQEQFKNALAEKSNMFVASLIDLYGSDAYLQNCEPQLVVMEALKAATLSLPISKSLGFAYIVPYKKNGKQIPQFQLGYKGMVQLAMRSGQYKYINADVVFEGEYKGFSKLTGELDISGSASGETVVGYFAHIETVNGFKKTIYMTRAKMEAHGARYSKSYSKNFSPWQTEFDSMATKTMLRMLLGKYGIMSIDMAEGMAMDKEPTDPYHEDANTTLIDIDTDTGEILQEQPSSADIDQALASQEQPETKAQPGF